MTEPIEGRPRREKTEGVDAQVDVAGVVRAPAWTSRVTPGGQGQLVGSHAVCRRRSGCAIAAPPSAWIL
jgi:hypothetical protein